MKKSLMTVETLRRDPAGKMLTVRVHVTNEGAYALRVPRMSSEQRGDVLASLAGSRERNAFATAVLTGLGFEVVPPYAGGEPIDIIPDNRGQGFVILALVK